MCLSVPGKLISLDGTTGRVDVEGTVVEADMTLTPDAVVGDFVLVHAGYAIEQYEPEEAQATLAMLRDAFRDQEH